MEQTIKLSSNFFLFQKHQNLQICFFPLCFRSPRFGNSSELWQIQKSVACLSDCTSNRSQTFANWIFILCKDNLIIALKSERSEQRKKHAEETHIQIGWPFFPLNEHIQPMKKSWSKLLVFRCVISRCNHSTWLIWWFMTSIFFLLLSEKSRSVMQSEQIVVFRRERA